MTDIQVRYWTLQEGIRHDIATESQARNELGEITRHNLITESQGQQIINENIRHNKVGEDIGYENARASLMQASAALQNATTNKRIADINQQNANTNAFNASTQAILTSANAKLATEKAAGQKMSNYVAGYGLNIKGTTSVFNAILEPLQTSVNTGTTFSNGVTSSIGNIIKAGL